MPGNLAGKVVAVTGAGRGTGRAVALLAAREGARVVVNDAGVSPDGSGSNAGPAEGVVREIRGEGGEAVALVADVSTMDGGEALVRQALDSFERLDVLVNVAGITRDRMVFNMTEAEWDAVIAVNLKAQFATIKPASIVFRMQRGGRIVNFSSIWGLTGRAAGQANFAAAKSGVAGLTRAVARDLGRYGVTCNAIAPGGASTLIARAAAEPRHEGEEALPDARDPDFVAPMTCYLATDAAGSINGQIFAVSGGAISLLNEPAPLRTIFKPGMWTLDELAALVPAQLMQGTDLLPQRAGGEPDPR